MNKKTMYILFAAVAVLALGGYWSLIGQKPSSSTEQASAPQQLKQKKSTTSVRYQSRTDFSTFLTLYLPQSMCAPDTFFRRCYLVTEEVCRETALAVTRECLGVQSEKMGEIIRAGEDVRYWQTMTGRCAGKFYDRDLYKFLKEDEDCLQ